jgi:hypothetical protein
MSADNLPDKFWNLSSYIMECGSSEKFQLLLEKFQLILRRTFFRNICCNIFMKKLGNILGKRNIPPAFTTVYLFLCLSLSDRLSLFFFFHVSFYPTHLTKFIYLSLYLPSPISLSLSPFSPLISLSFFVKPLPIFHFSRKRMKIFLQDYLEQ